MENQTRLASASVINDCPFLNKALPKLRQHSKRDLKAPQAEAAVQRIEVTIIVATSSSQTRNMASDQFTRPATSIHLRLARKKIRLEVEHDSACGRLRSAG